MSFRTLFKRLCACCRAFFTCQPRIAWEVLCWGGENQETLQLAGGAVLLLEKAQHPPVEVRPEEEPALQGQWDDAGVESAELVVRGVSGDVLLSEAEAKPSTPISQLVRRIRIATGTDAELVRLCFGNSVLRHGARLGDYLAPYEEDGVLELTFLKLPGPAVTVEATSNRRIQLLDSVPEVGGKCHFDRQYRFTSLGAFAERKSMRYLMTCNDDKGTPASQVMWRLNVHMPVEVYLNFRSEMHVQPLAAWLDSGWTRTSSMQSTVTTGIPNGPYSGPVYSKAVEMGSLDLMGSDCSEGTYFVFVDIDPDPDAELGQMQGK